MKSSFFMKIWKFQEIGGNLENEEEGRSTLRVYRAETWLTVYRTLAMKDHYKHKNVDHYHESSRG